MHIALYRLDIDVTENIGDFVQAHSALDQPGSTGIAEIMDRLRLGLNDGNVPIPDRRKDSNQF